MYSEVHLYTWEMPLDIHLKFTKASPEIVSKEDGSQEAILIEGKQGE